MTTKWEVNKAVRASGLPAPSRLIMLTLSDIAEAGTAEIPERFTPSLSVLARETGLGRSTVVEHLNALEEAKWIERTRPPVAAQMAGERTCYKLRIPDGVELRVVQQPDYPVQEPDGGSPGAGLEVVQEPDGGSPGAGHRSDLIYQPDPLTPATPPASVKGKRANRGTRIPDDFTATAEMIAWARQHTPNVGSKETAVFVDYWRARPGAGGVKLDWPATWRNWMRKAQTAWEERQRPQARVAPPSNAPSVIPPDQRCTKHPGQRAATCRVCASETKGARR